MGWIGQNLTDEELAGIDRVLSGLEHELGAKLAELLTAQEIEALAARCARLRTTGTFPAPIDGMPAALWPLSKGFRAAFNVVVKNAVHKGHHALASPVQHRYAVDRRLTCGTQHKLESVLWAGPARR